MVSSESTSDERKLYAKSELRLIRRFSAMSVMADIRPAVEAYRGLGCSLKEADDDLCVGVQAGDTYHLLVAEKLLLRSYSPDLAEVMKTLPSDVQILAQRSGEILLRLNGVLTMLADGSAVE